MPGGRCRMTRACGMRNGAGIRPPNSSGASGCGWSGRAVRPRGQHPGNRRGSAGHGADGAPVAAGLAGRRHGALRSRGPVSRERLPPRQWARLELELGKGPLAHGFAGDQRWTLGRIKTLIGKLFHVGYTVEGIWRLLRRHGGPARSRCARRWSATMPRSRYGRTRCGPI